MVRIDLPEFRFGQIFMSGMYMNQKTSLEILMGDALEAEPASTTPAEKRVFEERLDDVLAPKPWYTSKTVLGAAASIICVVASLSGIVLDSNVVLEILLLLVSASGSAFSIYGRFKALHPIE
jgi:hypothetical protein